MDSSPFPSRKQKLAEVERLREGLAGVMNSAARQLAQDAERGVRQADPAQVIEPRWKSTGFGG